LPKGHFSDNKSPIKSFELPVFVGTWQLFLTFDETFAINKTHLKTFVNSMKTMNFRKFSQIFGFF